MQGNQDDSFRLFAISICNCGFWTKRAQMSRICPRRLAISTVTQRTKLIPALRLPMIAWLIEGNEQYGVKRAILSLACAVQKAGVEPVMVSLNPGECATACQQAGLPVHLLHMGDYPGTHRCRSRWDRILNFFRLRNYQNLVRQRLEPVLRNQAISALHVLNSDLLPVVGKTANRLQVPCFWEMTNCLGQTYPFHINLRIYRWRLRRYGIQTLANSRFTAQTLGHATPKPEIMYLGVDSQRFTPNYDHPVSRAELGIPDHAAVLLIVARLDESKGQARVIQALANLGDRFGRIDLILVGEGNQGSEGTTLRKLASEHDFADRLHLVGKQASPERYYGFANLTINSRIDAEPFGLSVVESMMAGKPVLAHHLGGPGETILDGHTGWLIPEASVEGLTNGLIRALEDRPRWKEMGTLAREHALQSFSVEAQAKRYLELVNAHCRASEPRLVERRSRL